ncbi:MAG: protease modulator HflK N-terminal domain-containing protein, partial [Rhodocyclaceae bacterium]|nr:protease modulator HflK N-terminal domain-containing protein [Rhodocyclaceae bacterium]
MSLNDHGWGNDPKRGGGGRNQGPPDLDELWRDVNRRLTGIFGKKSGGPGNSGDGGGDGGGGPSLPTLTPGQFGGGVGLLLG